MPIGLIEGANACVGIGVGIAFIVTLSVAAANGGFVNIDDTTGDNSTLAALHYAADTVTDELSALDIDMDAYGPAVKIGCRMAEVECPSKISGVAVASITLGVIAVLMGMVAVFMRRQRRIKDHGRRLEGGYPDL